MNNQKDKKGSTETMVSEKIESGDIKMKPKVYFVVKTILLITALIILFLFVIYLISFILFSLHTSGLWFLPSFGWRGIGILFSSLPWWLIVISIALVLALEIFAERLSFIYHRPMIYSLIVIIVVILLVSLAVNFTPFHENLFESAYDQHLPILGSFYRSYGTPRIHNVHNGIVTKLTNNGVVIETPNNEIFNVIFNAQTLSSLQSTIKVGDALIVVGEKSGSTIQASDVRKIQEDMNLFPSHRLRPS